MDKLQSFLADEAMVEAVMSAFKEFFARPTTTTDVQLLAAERLVQNKLPAAFSYIRSLSLQKEQPAPRSQVGL